ncbi:putative RNA-directed DNA polymerase from mobile element jockey-like [Apostichopus japonicus]|uniref:Putative RNA-directed DNA polymerase from mobile element jockey-like n=1 Tax=Stichopus japonicus TaxID=307972 RepID=A0A2G8KUE0_STIJA|nr:putative RNA-directed DNA polymerase from mobile element jockey-like [Apostichopus japonicus]
MYQAGKFENVIKEKDNYKIQILGLAEARWLNSGHIVKEGYQMYFSGNDKHHVYGVGIIMEKTLARSVQGYWPISDRVMMVKMDATPFNLIIIQVYAPTSAHSREETEKFYEDVKKALDQASSQDLLIVMGDLNAKIGHGKDGIGERNERRDRLVEFCRENDLVIMNTMLQQHPRRLYTWKMPGDRSRNQIDYIMVRNRYKNSFKNVQTYLVQMWAATTVSSWLK